VTVAPSGEVTEAKTVAWGYHVSGDDTQARMAFLSAEPLNKRFLAAAEGAARRWRFDGGDEQWTTLIRFEFRAIGKTEQVEVFSPNAAPPPASAPGEPLRVGGSVKPPRLVKKVDPIYPDEAKAAHVQGVVILEVLIGRDGRVADTRVMRSIPVLDQAAIAAVKQWTYEPPL
jgi:TonB family protein